MSLYDKRSGILSLPLFFFLRPLILSENVLKPIFTGLFLIAHSDKL